MYFDPRWAAGHGLGRFAARMPSLAPPAIRPALWGRFGAIAWTSAGELAELIEAIYDDFEHELPDAPLADLGLDLIARGRPLADRRRGCIWLTLYPGVETATALAAILRDAGEPPELRDQAAWTLGFRQLQARAASLHWPADAIAIADDALADALCAGVDLPELPAACRHVAAPALHDRLAAGLADGTVPLARVCASIDAFASPALAAALLDRVTALDAHQLPVALPLIAHTLGDGATARLLAFAHDAPLTPRLEAIAGALAFAPDAAAPAAAALVADNSMMPQIARRLDWHRAHPRVVPLPRALAIARTTATIAPADRAAAAHLACTDFAALARTESAMPSGTQALWRHVAALAGGADAIDCATLDAHALAGNRALLAPTLDALARAGRFAELARFAVEHRDPARATWLLARGGRPFRALAMRRLARADDLFALAGQALALFAAGRPDLAMRAIALPPRPTPALEQPPGADEAWRAGADPLLKSYLAQDLLALAGLAVPAPPGADPDVVDLSHLAALERALAADLAGASVHLAGRFPDASRIRAAIERRGGLVVSGPFGKVDFVLIGDEVDPGELARLTALGATPLSPVHLE